MSFQRVTILIVCITLLFGSISFLSSSAAQEIPMAEVKMHNGAPAIFINGEPTAGMTYMTYNIRPEIYKAFGEIGVDLASFSTTADFGFYWPSYPIAWTGDGEYDFSDTDRRIEQILTANPNALIFPRIYVCSPPWWDDLHPGELALDHAGSDDRVILQQGRKNKIPSWASEQWKKDTAENLRQFIRHVRAKYGKNIIGYHIASGHTEEWFYWPSYSHAFLDYSRPQTRAFRAWLRKKYRTEAALREAWNNPAITFESVQVPYKTERIRHDFFQFRDPEKSRNVIDYYIFHSEVVVETIEYLAKAAKEACNYESLVGVFYGYIFELAGSALASQNGGHLAMAKMLECPYVDFYTSPTSYMSRQVGTGASTYMSAIGSVKLHGKLWMDENDYRTHLTPDTPYNVIVGRSGSLHLDEQNQKRQMGHELANASGAWWFDMGGGWYDTPEFMKIIAKLNSIGGMSIHFDRGSAAEIAAVVDERSVCALSLDNAVTAPALRMQREPLAKIGAPVDYLYLDDLDKARPYKMYIFLNAFSINDKQMEAIRSLKAKGAGSFLWIYAPNFSGKTLDVKRCRETTGIRLGLIPEEAKLNVRISQQGSSYFETVEEGTEYGSEFSIGPVFYADDPEVEILGTLRNIDKPGLVTRNVDGIRTFYSAAPLLSAKVLRAIAQKSGVHIYNRADDVLYVNNTFLTLHSNAPGTRTIHLRKPGPVYDVYNDRLIAGDALEFQIDMPGKDTRMFFLGTEQEWQNAGKQP